MGLIISLASPFPPTSLKIISPTMSNRDIISPLLPPYTANFTLIAFIDLT